MNIVFDGDLREPEIKISGEPWELRELGTALLDMRDRCTIESERTTDRYYPELLDGLTFELENMGNEEPLLAVTLSRDYLIFKGPAEGFRRLGQSLLNVFPEQAPQGTHMHLDYFEGNDLLAPTSCHLIFESK